MLLIVRSTKVQCREKFVALQENQFDTDMKSKFAKIYGTLGCVKHTQRRLASRLRRQEVAEVGRMEAAEEPLQLAGEVAESEEPDRWRIVGSMH